MAYFLYAETAFHHEGDLSYLLGLVDAAADAGCHGVKFQVLLDLDELMSRFHPSYVTAGKWLLSDAEWRQAFARARDRGLAIVGMPADRAAVAFMESLPILVAYYDVHSVSFHDDGLLKALRKTAKPVILGVGGRTAEEVASAAEFFGDQLHMLMVGFQAYPSNPRDVKLNRIATLKSLFPRCRIGYADHTVFSDPLNVSCMEYAYVLGARAFEKHITLDPGSKRTDYEAAAGPEAVKDIRSRLDRLEELLKDESAQSLLLCPAEKTYRNRQKVLVAARDIATDTPLAPEDVCLKVAATPGAYHDFGSLKGAVTSAAILGDEAITAAKLRWSQ